MRSTIRTSVVLALTTGLVATAAPAALAGKPVTTTTPFSGTTVVEDLCSFPVTVSAEGTYRTTDFTDARGVLTRTLLHAVETDTFSANGVTLVGDTYRPQFRIEYAPDGTVTEFTSRGVLARVPLPDGRTFLSAGRLDFLASDEDFLVTPDSGTVKHLDAFCDALAG